MTDCYEIDDLHYLSTNEEECVASCRDGEYLDSATHKCAFCIASMVFCLLIITMQKSQTVLNAVRVMCVKNALAPTM